MRQAETRCHGDAIPACQYDGQALATLRRRASGQRIADGAHMQERRTLVVPVDAGGICSRALQYSDCQHNPPRDTGVHRAAFMVNTTPIHDIRCIATLTWTRVGTHAFRQGLPVFLRYIAAATRRLAPLCGQRSKAGRVDKPFAEQPFALDLAGSAIPGVGIEQIPTILHLGAIGGVQVTQFARERR